MMRLLGVALGGILLLAGPPGRAEQSVAGIGLSASGFLTLAAGRIVGGDPAGDFNGYRSPIFVADYAQGGVYESGGWSMKPSSKLGVQGTAAFGGGFAMTGQAVARGARDGKVDIEWIYANQAIDNSLTLQIGRKRLPLFYYSESQDVGFAYPWAYLPPSLYGWEVVNYNGANLLYHGQWGRWSTVVNAFAGSETKTDNGYWKIYNGKSRRTDSKWSNIIGTDLTLTRGWFETRLAYVQSDFQNRPEDSDYSTKARQRIYSLSFNVDTQDWLVRAENLYMDRRPVGEEDLAFLLGIGRRIGRFLPMLTHTRYRMRLTPGHADATVIDPAGVNPLANEAWTTTALSLRYELTPTSAVKAQLDRWRDRNGSRFNGGVPYGNATLLSLSYDMVF